MGGPWARRGNDLARRRPQAASYEGFRVFGLMVWLAARDID
jgi:hypothetical protein